MLIHLIFVGKRVAWVPELGDYIFSDNHQQIDIKGRDK